MRKAGRLKQEGVAIQVWIPPRKEPRERSRTWRRELRSDDISVLPSPPSPSASPNDTELQENILETNRQQTRGESTARCRHARSSVASGHIATCWWELDW